MGVLIDNKRIELNIQRCSIFSKIGFAFKITDVNSDVCKLHSD